MEVETNAKNGYLRINRGGEFTLGTFNEFCKQHGIPCQLTQSHIKMGLPKGKIVC